MLLPYKSYTRAPGVVVARVEGLQLLAAYWSVQGLTGPTAPLVGLLFWRGCQACSELGSFDVPCARNFDLSNAVRPSGLRVCHR